MSLDCIVGADALVSDYDNVDNEDPDLQLARAMTMEELSQEIQAILRRVNLSFSGRSQALADEFIGLQEAIQATLMVTKQPSNQFDYHIQ